MRCMEMYNHSHHGILYCKHPHGHDGVHEGESTPWVWYTTPIALHVQNRTRAMREELIAAVLADPDALWAVLSRADVRHIAGPWLREDRGSWRLRTINPDGPHAATVTPKHDGWWRAQVSYPDGFTMTAYAETSHESQDAAEQWCDDRLREAGVLLATQ